MYSLACWTPGILSVCFWARSPIAWNKMLWMCHVGAGSARRVAHRIEGTRWCATGLALWFPSRLGSSRVHGLGLYHVVTGRGYPWRQDKLRSRSAGRTLASESTSLLFAANVVYADSKAWRSFRACHHWKLSLSTKCLLMILWTNYARVDRTKIRLYPRWISLRYFGTPACLDIRGLWRLFPSTS